MGSKHVHSALLFINVFVCSGIHLRGSFGARRDVQASGSESALTSQRNAPAIQSATPAPVASLWGIFRSANHRPPNAHHKLRRPTRWNDGYSSSIVSTSTKIRILHIRLLDFQFEKFQKMIFASRGISKITNGKILLYYLHTFALFRADWVINLDALWCKKIFCDTTLTHTKLRLLQASAELRGVTNWLASWLTDWSCRGRGSPFGACSVSRLVSPAKDYRRGRAGSIFDTLVCVSLLFN